MSFAPFLDGLVAVAGQDIAWLISIFFAGGLLLAFYIPILELVAWMRSKYRR